jgi:hypothetical protein
MKKILFILLLVIAGSAAAAGRPSDVGRFHDDELNVTCWHKGGGISCIPDSQLEPECGPHEEEQNESRPASSPGSNQREGRTWL